MSATTARNRDNAVKLIKNPSFTLLIISHNCGNVVDELVDSVSPSTVQMEKWVVSA